MLDMAESGEAESEDWGANLGIGDDLDAEDVGEAGSAVVSKGAEDQIFALLVEDQYAGEHSEWLGAAGAYAPKFGRGCCCSCTRLK